MRRRTGQTVKHRQAGGTEPAVDASKADHCDRPVLASARLAIARANNAWCVEHALAQGKNGLIQWGHD